METKNDIFYPSDFVCKTCEFKCRNKKDYNRHLLTGKHLIKTKWKHDGNNLPQKTPHHKCSCGKIYNTRSGLWKHKKMCIIPHDTNDTNDTNQINLPAKNDDIIKYLMNENKELKSMIMEICKKESIQNNTTNNNTINQTNKTFNLQFFLNETCKDAMNISEFIENISLQLSDLENIGKLGYVEGISNIIIKNLKALEVEKRPLHCSDIKREIMYVKDDDKWEKEPEEKQKIKQVISRVVSKNLGLLPAFQKKYPECMKSESKKSDEYNLIIMEAMRNVDKNKEKIIKKIAKEVTIEKNQINL